MTTAEDLVTMAVNDGNGSQCGKTYEERCAMARMGASIRPIVWFRVANFVNDWNCLKGAPTASAQDVLRAAADLADYYAEHIKEL